MIDLAARLYCLLVRLPSAAIGYWLIQIRIHWCGREAAAQRPSVVYRNHHWKRASILPLPSSLSSRPSERALALFAFPSLSRPRLSMSSRLVHRMTTVVCRSSVLCAIAVSRSQQSIVCVCVDRRCHRLLAFAFFLPNKAAPARTLFPLEGERDRGKLGGGGGGDSCPTHKINVCLTGPLSPSLPRPSSPSCCRLGPWRGFSLLPSRGRVGQHRWA